MNDNIKFAQIVDQSIKSLNRPINQIDYPYVSKDGIT